MYSSLTEQTKYKDNQSDLAFRHMYTELAREKRPREKRNDKSSSLLCMTVLAYYNKD